MWLFCLVDIAVTWHCHQNFGLFHFNSRWPVKQTLINAHLPTKMSEIGTRYLSCLLCLFKILFLYMAIISVCLSSKFLPAISQALNFICVCLHLQRHLEMKQNMRRQRLSYHPTESSHTNSRKRKALSEVFHSPGIYLNNYTLHFKSIVGST